MRLRVESTPLQDLLLLTPEVFEDARGFFLEVYRADTFREAGLPDTFVQFNHSRSARNVVRGLHFQWDPPMGKLMRVTEGRAYLVAVDIRKGSPTLGQYWGVELSSQTRQQVWAPAGFARGFAVLSEYAEIQYLCTGTYNAKGEGGILWNDPQLGIRWPVSQPTLSEKDGGAPTLAQWLATPTSNLFAFEG